MIKKFFVMRNLKMVSYYCFRPWNFMNFIYIYIYIYILLEDENSRIGLKEKGPILEKQISKDTDNAPLGKI